MSKKCISFFTSDEMHDQLHKASKKRDLSVSHLLRWLARDFLRSEDSMETKSKGDTTK